MKVANSKKKRKKETGEYNKCIHIKIRNKYS